MRTFQKWKFVIVFVLILAIAYCALAGIRSKNGDLTITHIKGVSDIRWGIDIRGGVDATFAPSEGVDATNQEMAAAEAIINLRLLNKNITDSEVYIDYDNDRIIVRFPWKSDEEDFDPQAAIRELGETAMLAFYEGNTVDDDGLPTGDVVLTGANVKKAEAVVNTQTNEYMVSLELDEEGTEAFSDATLRLQGTGYISIWMDDTMISAPLVNEHITEGKAVISGNFTAESASDLANKINAGALPFQLVTENFSTISPTLGLGARDAMGIAAVIAFGVIALIMILFYRLPGFVAVIALLGQMALTIASITGFFNAFSSFTLTLPGIAGIILAVGFGVDANVITAERIKEEMRKGKTVDGAIDAGCKASFSAILDGNVTVVIVAIILMAAFGSPNSLFTRLFSFVFSWFGPSTAGSIYSFGYTLLIGVILNMVMGVFFSRVMLRSISKWKIFRSPFFYGGDK